MTREQSPFRSSGPAEAGAEIAQLRRLLGIVDGLAGEAGVARGGALDQAARISAAYEISLPIDRKRFDHLAGTTARWAAVGAAALLTIDEKGGDCRAARRTFAAALRCALDELERIVRA